MKQDGRLEKCLLPPVPHPGCLSNRQGSPAWLQRWGALKVTAGAGAVAGADNLGCRCGGAGAGAGSGTGTGAGAVQLPAAGRPSAAHPPLTPVQVQQGPSRKPQPSLSPAGTAHGSKGKLGWLSTWE